MKTELLAMLRESGDFYSGQELCEHFGVSRTAIWKRIRQLQDEGYEIEAVKNKGYRLAACPDSIAADEVESRLESDWVVRPVHYFSVIDSTNNYCKRIAEDGAPEGSLVIADEQTAGKGRRGRKWETPPGTAVAFTLLLRPETVPPEKIAMVTLIMGLAVARAVRKLYGLDAGIKWPNDAVIGGKKLCGILTEMTTDLMSVSYVVIGTGINANVKSFPEELKDTATSLAVELGHDVVRSELIAEVVGSFEKFYKKFLQTCDLSLLQDEYNELLLNKDRTVRVLEPGNEYTGLALGIDKEGQLLVKREDGSVTAVYAGEVSVRGVYGYV